MRPQNDWLPKPPSSPTQQPFSPSHNSNSSELINQSPSPQFNTNPLQQPPQIRRASSSRMLPTPPPNAHGTDFSQTPVSPTMNMFSPSPSPPFSSTDLRRPSTGRRLPPEPTVSVVLTSLFRLPLQTTSTICNDLPPHGRRLSWPQTSRCPIH